MKVLLVCILLPLVTGQGSGRPKDGGPPSGKPEKDKDMDPWKGVKDRLGRPDMPDPEDACDTEDLSAAVSGVIMGVLNGTSTAADILPLVRQVPLPCLPLLATQFSAGQCSAAEASEALCAAGGMPEVVMALVKCLQPADICTVLTAILNDQTKAKQCVTIDSMGSLVRLALEKTCTLTDSSTFFYLPPDQFEQRLKLLTLDEFKALLLKVSQDPEMVMMIPCGHAELLSKMVDEKQLLDFSQLATGIDPSVQALLPLLPYLPASVCAKFPSFVVQLLLPQVKSLNFQCGKKDHDIDDMYKKMERDHGKSKGKDGDDDDDDSHKKDEEEKAMRDMDTMMSWARERDHDPSCDRIMTCGEGLIKSLLQNFDLKQDNVQELLGNLSACVPKNKQHEMAKPGQCQKFGPQFLSTSRASSQLARKCASTESPDLWGTQTVASAGCPVTSLDAPTRSKVPTDALCAALGSSLSECIQRAAGVREDFLRDIGKKCLKQLDADKIAKYGAAAIHAGCDEMKTMSATDREAAAQTLIKGLEGMAEERTRGSKGKAACSKMADLPLNLLASSREAMRQLSHQDLARKLAGGNPRTLLGIGSGPGPDLPQAKNKMAYEVIKGQKKVTDMDVEEIRSMGSVVTAMASNDILNVNRNRMEIMQLLCQHSNWKGKSMESLGQLAENAMTDFNTVNPMEHLTDDKAKNLDAACVVGLGDRLVNVTNEVCRTLCDRLAATPVQMCAHNSKLRQRLQTVCLKCNNVDGDSQPLNEDMVEKLGRLMMNPDLIKKISSSVLKKVVRSLPRMRCMSKAMRDAVQTKLNEAITSADDEDTITGLGAWAMLLSKEKRDQLKDKFTEVFNTAGKDLDVTEEDACCEKEQTDAEMEAVENSMDKAHEAMAYMVLQTAPTSSRRRRSPRARRQTTDIPKCADVITMKQSASMLTAAQIEGMLDAEFNDCVSFFGKVEGWTKDQLQALYTKLKSVRGKVCAMTSLHLQDLGTIGYALPPADIKCMENLDNDAISNLGELHLWSQEQLTEFAKRYMQLSNQVAASSLTTDHIKFMGHFLCGLTADEITKIPVTSYSGASSIIGELKSCARDRLQKLAELAKHSSAHGPIANWEASKFGDIGIVLAGLSDDDLKTADEEDISQWTFNGIKNLHTDSFRALSVDQLRYLSREQALVVPPQVRSGLDVARRNALACATAGYDCADADLEDPTGPGGNKVGGAATVGLSVSTMVSFIIIAFL